MKQHKIEFLTNFNTRTIFAACLHSILAIDFPSGKWPSFLSSVLQLLQSSETNQVETGLAALWEVVSLYRFKAAEKRQPLVQIVESTFPLLLVIANNLVTRLEEVAGRMLHRVFKIYYASMQVKARESLVVICDVIVFSLTHTLTHSLSLLPPHS